MPSPKVHFGPQLVPEAGTLGTGGMPPLFYQGVQISSLKCAVSPLSKEVSIIICKINTQCNVKNTIYKKFGYAKICNVQRMTGMTNVRPWWAEPITATQKWLLT